MMTRYADRRTIEKKFEDNGGGYIYLILRGDGKYKIGIAFDVAKRMKQLSKKHGHLILVQTFFSKWAFNYEKAYHQMYHDKHIRAEWFALTPDDVKRIHYQWSYMGGFDYIFQCWRDPIYFGES